MEKIFLEISAPLHLFLLYIIVCIVSEEWRACFYDNVCNGNRDLQQLQLIGSGLLHRPGCRRLCGQRLPFSGGRTHPRGIQRCHDHEPSPADFGRLHPPGFGLLLSLSSPPFGAGFFIIIYPASVLFIPHKIYSS